ncbi:LOW QUALITY PROTEIN: Aldose 1-/Glucose-6-phosphate 1-epimerase, partial [Dillenia turbinata]
MPLVSSIVLLQPRTLPSSSSFLRVNRIVSSASMSKEATSLEVEITEGLGNLPKVFLKSDSGSEAEIYLFGGCMTSWKPAGGRDLLLVRPSCWCQRYFFAGLNELFSNLVFYAWIYKNMNWSIVDSEKVEGNPILTLELKDEAYGRSMWDYSFQALHKVILKPKSLSTELVITNTDQKPFSFGPALHTYFQASITGTSMKGLKACKTLNKDPDPKNPLEGKEDRDVITFPGFVDCIYLDAPSENQLDNGLGDIITIRNTKNPARPR